LARQRPERIVYAPNYWQWLSHHLNHGLLPPEIADCRTQLDLIRHLGLDVFSRNSYCDQQRCWFGGLAEEIWDGIEVREEVHPEQRDRVITSTYLTRRGALTERLRYVFAESTLVQEFYEKASRIAHENGSMFFIHACGRQRANLKRIDALGVDGLEGVAFPPLGDVQLDEAMRLTSDRFIITGGISAMETENLQTAAEVRRYVKDMFGRLRPYAHRFMLSASCNTSIRTPWRALQWFRDAWQEFAGT
jgi:hypothetical protein